MADVGQRVVMDLRNELFRHILGQSAGFFAQGATGQLLSRINNDVGQVQQAVSETVGDLARESLALVGFAALMFYYDARLTLVLPDRRAARSSIRWSASVSAYCRTTRRSQEGARAAVAPQHRSVHRASDRQGVRHRGGTRAKVRAGRLPLVPHRT